MDEAKAPEPIRRVLVVEDMDTLREYLVETLGDLGDEVVVDGAVDGVEALTMVDGEPPYDLVFTDITMPRMDGETLLQELRSRAYPAAVVVLTAHGQDDIILRCMKAGACDYLVKPVSIDDLLLAANAAHKNAPAAQTDLNVDFDPHGWFEVSGSSDYSVLYRYRKFLNLLNRTRLQPSVANEVRLTLEELGRNAIEWGNRGDREKQVRFGCRILPTKVIILIADEGEGFVPDAVPDPSLDPIAHIQDRQEQGKRLGGYGIHLVRNIMDKVTWNDRGNKVVAIKYFDNPS